MKNPTKKQPVKAATKTTTRSAPEQAKAPEIAAPVRRRRPNEISNLGVSGDVQTNMIAARRCLEEILYDVDVMTGDHPGLDPDPEDARDRILRQAKDLLMCLHYAEVSAHLAVGERMVA